MVFPVVGGTQDTGYEISNSLRFNYPDSPQLSFTPSSDGNKRVATASFWLKRGVSRASNDLHIMGSQEDGSNLYSIRIRSSGNADVFQFLNAVSGSTSNGFTYRTTGGASFRDHSAWYHFVVAMDVTQSDGNNGLKLYVNGVLQDTYSISNYNQNVDVSFNTSGEAMKIGIKSDDSEPFDGYLADFHWIDGTQKQASDFGEYNDNGVWIPKKYDGSYGTNGFYLEFKQTGTSQNSSGIGADTSGNDNHFAVSNLAAVDVTTDTPTNNFSTFNVLANRISYETTFTEGNTDADFDDSNYGIALTTQAATSGKWYAEFKIIATGGTVEVGVANPTQTSNTTAANYRTYMQTGQKETDGTTRSSYGNTYTANDIISVAMDLDNGNIYFYKNGTIENSGTAAFTDLVSAMPISGWCFYAFGFNDAQVQLNTGNAPFSISSGNSDGAGHGNFEYSVPSGYFALCTKNLATYG
jgi:hypothetical protein